MTIASTIRRASICVAGLALLVGCSDDKPAASAPTQSATPAATPSPTWKPPADQAGVRACEAVRADSRTGQVPDWTVLKAAAADGKQSNDFDIRARSNLLASALELAEAAKGHADELRMSLNAMTAATELQTACIKGGYFRPGTG